MVAVRADFGNGTPMRRLLLDSSNECSQNGADTQMILDRLWRLKCKSVQKNLNSKEPTETKLKKFQARGMRQRSFGCSAQAIHTGFGTVCSGHIGVTRRHV